EPFDYENLALLGAVLTELGEYEEALSVFCESMDSHPTADVLAMIGYVYALSGERNKADSIIKKLKLDCTGTGRHPIKLARIYLALENLETTYDLLDAAFDRHELDLTAITYDPRWKTIRSENRFVEFIKRIGF